MKQKIIELRYKNNPNLFAFFNISNIIALSLYLLGVFSSIYYYNDYDLGFFTFVMFTPIIIITSMYFRVFESLSLGHL